MRAPITPVLFVAFIFAQSHHAAAADAAARIRVDINEPDSLTSAKPLRMTVEEIGRDERTSTMLVRYESGASVASSMFIMNAVWQVARARGDRYVMMLSETKVSGGREHVIGFCKERRDDYLEYFGINRRDGKRDKFEWLDMNQFDVLWRR